jgi:hypothetical protein
MPDADRRAKLAIVLVVVVFLLGVTLGFLLGRLG